MEASLATVIAPIPVFLAELNSSSSQDDDFSRVSGSSAAMDADLNSEFVAAVQLSPANSSHSLTVHGDQDELDDENDFLKDMEAFLALIPETTEPESVSEEPLFAFPSEGSALFSSAGVLRPEAPTHGTQLLPVNFNFKVSLSDRGIRDEKKVPKMDAAETIAARNKLMPKSRRIEKKTSAEKQPHSVEATAVAKMDKTEVDQGKEISSGPLAPELQSESRRDGKANALLLSLTTNRLDSTDQAPPVLKPTMTSQLAKEIDGDVAPMKMGSLVLPGGNTIHLAASSTVLPPASINLPPKRNCAPGPEAADEQPGEKLAMLQKRAKVLQSRKANPFHNHRRNAAPSTAYGTRALGSAERVRDLRSSQSLADTNSHERQAREQDSAPSTGGGGRE